MISPFFCRAFCLQSFDKKELNLVFPNCWDVKTGCVCGLRVSTVHSIVEHCVRMCPWMGGSRPSKDPRRHRVHKHKPPKGHFTQKTFKKRSTYRRKVKMRVKKEKKKKKRTQRAQRSRGHQEHILQLRQQGEVDRRPTRVIRFWRITCVKIQI